MTITINKSLITPIVIILLAVLIGGGLLVTGKDKTSTFDVDASQTSLRKVDLAIDNLFCIGCRSSIVNSVQAMPGVIQADADTRTDSGWVIYDPTQINKEQIVAASVFDAYPARILDDQPYEGDGVGTEISDLPEEIEKKLSLLAQRLQEKDITMEDFFQKELDDAIEQGFWDKANNLLDNYLEAYN